MLCGARVLQVVHVIFFCDCLCLLALPVRPSSREKYFYKANDLFFSLEDLVGVNPTRSSAGLFAGAATCARLLEASISHPRLWATAPKQSRRPAKPTRKPQGLQ